jgi:regulator of RNase E activity RraB
VFRRRKKLSDLASKDALVIQQLQEQGADLTKPLAVDHFLYFPTGADAEALADKLNQSGYSAHHGKAAQGDQWVVKAGKATVVTLESITAARSALTDLAAAHHGEYDGWGALIPN